MLNLLTLFDVSPVMWYKIHTSLISSGEVPSGKG